MYLDECLIFPPPKKNKNKIGIKPVASKITYLFSMTSIFFKNYLDKQSSKSTYVDVHLFLFINKHLNS